ncbi:MAG: hypothetical protein H6739_09005 [Alphaproteobacteria bacterium]|nr:hypothetical protein [Alphaproteobacteria bacterium]
MCIFTRSVRRAGPTRLFARALEDRRQALVVQVDVERTEGLAVVVPLPVSLGCRLDDIELVDLSRCTGFFADVGVAFGDEAPARAVGPDRLGRLDAQLAVGVDALEALGVPLGEDVRQRLPLGDHTAFAVLRMGQPGRRLLLPPRRRRLPPLGIVFPRLDPTCLYFPTVIAVDDTIEETTLYEHALYAQLEDGGRPPLDTPWQRSDAPLGEGVDAARANDLVAPSLPGWRLLLQGEHPNEDTWLAPTVFTMVGTEEEDSGQWMRRGSV